MRLKGLNKRFFLRELRRVLKKEYSILLKYDSSRAAWINDAARSISESGYYWFEVPAYMTRSGRPEIVDTCPK